MTRLLLSRVGWVLALLLAFGLPAAWRPAVWGGSTLLFLALTTHGVVSIRSRLFGRARLWGSSSDAVALTYDDGPDPEATPALLDLLRREGARATFFVVGERARAHPELVRRCAAEGHELANHSDRHGPLHNLLGRRRLRDDLERCQAAVEEACGARPRLHRPPVGLRNPSTHRVCDELGLELVGWDVRSLDRSRREPREVARRVLRRANAGSIVLLHDGGQTVERVVAINEALLRGLRERGLGCVALGELGTLRP